MRSRYLTKSKFQMAMQCKTKMFYDGKPEYANKCIEDPFLESLAQGGFQVGALAKLYFPGGQDIETKNHEDAIRQTKKLLLKPHAIIYEAAFCYDNLFVRTDILIKEGNTIELIEVKAKSFDVNKDSFLTKKGEISSGWREYLCDVAFQKYVLNLALPGYEVKSSLMLADKNALCPIDGLNQMFRIIKDEHGKKSVRVSASLKAEHLVPPLLIKINTDACCDQIIASDIDFCGEKIGFSEYVKRIADLYEKDEKLGSYPSTVCKSCEFQASVEEQKMGLLSGFHECWKENLGWKDEDFEEGTVLDIWNFRRKNNLIQDGRIKLSAVTIEDILPGTDNKPGLSASQRQWLQIEKSQTGDTIPWIDIDNLSKEMNSWVYPLHFIDFETSMAAIPFNKGKHPYEGIAFQFSHHIVNKNGVVVHKGQYLNAQPGVFPNYDFVRALKSELDMDEGTIFRYAAHENTYLNIIRKQLLEDNTKHLLRHELCAFIESITKSTDNSDREWEGSRNMVDMCELVKRYYYNPATKGSNSIKYVLPAMLNSSAWLQKKYANPIYGAENGILSLNFRDWKWIEFDKGGQVIDPYKLLPVMFQDLTDKENELLSDANEINNGGAALTAYAKLQYEDMSAYERQEIQSALLKYCELDTLAMVMIYEGWKNLLE